jgi:hypothetical protein
VIHPSTELRFVNETLGYGVFATALIPCGTITWAGDDLDQVFSREQFDRLNPAFQRIVEHFGYTDPEGNQILCWDHARYVNHSCEPNCMSPGYNFDLAIRDIQPGEQLSNDYGSLNIVCPFDCICGSPRCRTHVGPEDILRYAEEWDAKVGPAFQRISAVDQPLWWLVEEKNEIERVLAGTVTLSSCRSNYDATRLEGLPAKSIASAAGAAEPH